MHERYPAQVVSLLYLCSTCTAPLTLQYGADVLMLNVDNCLPVDLVTDADVQQLLYDEMEKKGISGLDQVQQLRQSRASNMLTDIRKAVSSGLDLNALEYQGVAAVRDYALVCACVWLHVRICDIHMCACVCIRICTYVCMYVRMYICMYACMHACMCVCT